MDDGTPEEAIATVGRRLSRMVMFLDGLSDQIGRAYEAVKAGEEPGTSRRGTSPN